ncbi:MAG: hypothetical protein AAGJ80_16230, partial [Cyanobacteria bacterium J06553_1]
MQTSGSQLVSESQYQREAVKLEFPWLQTSDSQLVRESRGKWETVNSELLLKKTSGSQLGSKPKVEAVDYQALLPSNLLEEYEEVSKVDVIIRNQDPNSATADNSTGAMSVTVNDGDRSTDTASGAATKEVLSQVVQSGMVMSGYGRFRGHWDKLGDAIEDSYDCVQWLADTDQRIVSKKITNEADKIREASAGCHPTEGDAKDKVSRNTMCAGTYAVFKQRCMEIWRPKRSVDPFTATKAFFFMAPAKTVGGQMNIASKIGTEVTESWRSSDQIKVWKSAELAAVPGSVDVEVVKL